MRRLEQVGNFIVMAKNKLFEIGKKRKGRKAEIEEAEGCGITFEIIKNEKVKDRKQGTEWASVVKSLRPWTHSPGHRLPVIGIPVEMVENIQFSMGAATQCRRVAAEQCPVITGMRVPGKTNPATGENRFGNTKQVIS